MSPSSRTSSRRSLPNVSAGRRHLRRADRGQPWAAASCTTRRSTRSSACGAHDVGGVRGQQRGHQGGRHRAGRRDVHGATWTSQLFVLADYYNVQTAVPDFAEQYTNNQAKYATTPAALAGFQHLQEGIEKGWWQPDFARRYFDDGHELLATGEMRALPDADLRGRRRSPRTSRSQSMTSASSRSPGTDAATERAHASGCPPRRTSR